MTNISDEVLDRLVQWAARRVDVRVLLLASSRAQDDTPLDAFSDYDVLLVVSDPRPFVDDDAWQSELGVPIVTFGDAKCLQGIETYTRLVLYEAGDAGTGDAGGIKIDYMLWPVELARAVVERRELPDLLDWGYRVLLDKDALTDGLPAPTRTAYIPRRPSEREYRALVEEFWWESTYVAKNLWRDDLISAKYNLDVVMKLDLLRRLLEWRIEIDHGWRWRPGVLGRGLKRHLAAETWAALEATYAGAEIEANWRALFATTELFRRIANEVANVLGYVYPHDLDRRVTAYLRHVRQLPRPASSR